MKSYCINLLVNEKVHRQEDIKNIFPNMLITVEDDHEEGNLLDF